MEQLKPCPNCNSDMYLNTVEGQNWITNQNGFITTLSCSKTDCCCFVKIFSPNREEAVNAEKKAFEYLSEYWNGRADNGKEDI